MVVWNIADALSSVTSDRERWAEALHVERVHGDDAPRIIAERVGELALAGDRPGIDRWVEIGTRFDALRRRKGQVH